MAGTKYITINNIVDRNYRIWYRYIEKSGSSIPITVSSEYQGMI